MKANRNLIPALLLTALCACNAPKSPENVVVYYSQTGSTDKVAQVIASQTNATAIRLECEKPYPDTFDATIAESRDEVMNNTGRALTNATLDLDRCDTIFIGTPVWYGTITPPIVTLAQANNLFAGKTVVLFCTYGSGGRKASEAAFRALCPEANVLGSFGIAGRRVETAAEDEVKAFISRLRTDKSLEMVGAFGEMRDLDDHDRDVFSHATKDYAYLALTPQRVSTQVVAGTNYLFECQSVGPDGNPSIVEVRIFAPLPGRGDPEVISVER